MAADLRGPFKDPTDLTNWTRWSLFAQIGVSVVAMASDGMQLQLLQNMQLGTFASPEELTAATTANDARQAIMGVAQFLTIATSGVLILMWIYRANLNAHRLGAERMDFSPGWAVGWYFVPVANLWQPYRAMKEIWQASANPSNWKNEDRTWLLPLWWTLWIISNIVDNVALRLAFRADQDIDQLIAATGVMIFSELLTIPLAAVLLALVGKIFTMQIQQAQVQSFA